MVSLTWKLWRQGNSRIRNLSNDFTFMGWQSYPIELDTYGWVQAPSEIYVPWVYDMGQAACDHDYAEFEQQYYAPWGQYTGPQYPDGRVSQWAVEGFEALGCNNVTTGTPSPYYFAGSNGIFSRSTQCLGSLSSGHMGNWTDGNSSTSIRRSSSGWSVF